MPPMVRPLTGGKELRVRAIAAQVDAEPAVGSLLSGFVYAANGAPLERGVGVQGLSKGEVRHALERA